MTNDESEIRRLAHEFVITGCPNDGTHTLTCDDCSAAIRTALAAEREQHARDVADARADGLREAEKVARDRVASCRCNVRNSCGMCAEDNSLADLYGLMAEARARALNDSRPPSGINQGCGAGDILAHIQAAQLRCAAGIERCWTGCDRLGKVPDGATPHRPYAPPPSPASPAGTPWQCSGCGENNPAINDRCRKCRALETWCGRHQPASPTGETRDEHDEMCPCNECTGLDIPDCGPDGHQPCCRKYVPPASAPGGAPGVETCGLCKGKRGYHDVKGWWNRCPLCGGAGTTPTPSTETPTGGR